MINVAGNILKLIFSNKYVSTLLTMFLVFYGGNAAPDLLEIKDFYKHIAFRVFILSLIVYKSGGLDNIERNGKVTYSIVIALAFTSLFELLNKKCNESKENFAEEEETFPQCSNKPDAGRKVQQVIKSTDGSCSFIYDVLKYPSKVCTGTFEGVKFCTNSSEVGKKVIGCSKLIPDLDFCLFYYDRKLKEANQFK